MLAMNPMFSVHSSECTWLDQSIKLETGHIARQASGAVMVSSGNARLLCTVVVSSEPVEEDFLPLSVHYVEKFSADGRIPGGFIKRETKPSDHEVLISRIIDRSIRPFFDKTCRFEIQVTCTLHSHDATVDTVMLGVVGTSAALGLAGVPFAGPVSGIRVGCENNTWVVLSPDRVKSSSLDLFVAGTKQGIAMVECQTDERNHGDVVDALSWAHDALQPLNDLVVSFVDKAGASRHVASDDTCPNDAMYTSPEWDDVCRLTDIKAQKEKLAAMKNDWGVSDAEFMAAWRTKARQWVASKKVRLDGRELTDVRPIHCQTRYLPSCHGSAVFTRGSTQALVSVTLGSSSDAQIVDSVSYSGKENFLLHYNFPPFSVGETGRIGAPGRRELGHGYLARKGIQPVMPDMSSTVRVVSDITESNGSSSMATVCGACLALFDAGIALKRPVAGVAMGMIAESDNCVILTDISGQEDWLGDMDFKVVGTEKGITALQMDLKGQALSRNFFQKALDQAHDGLMHILTTMRNQSLSLPATDNPNAPAFGTVTVSKDMIGAIIGSGGKTIRALCEETGAKIDIADNGTISIMGANAASLDHAIRAINKIVQKPEIGQIYDGTIVGLKDFGAFVDFGFGRDGLLHISEIGEGKIESIQNFVSEGQSIRVKVVDIDQSGRIKLTCKGVNNVKHL
jgi:polyribonucleotide nucleotidyltransferase